MSNGIGRDSLRKYPIKLEKDSLVEARDAYGTWYPAKVREIKDDKVHIHFCNWSSRYDTWYPITSDCLRSLKRVATSVNLSNAKVSNSQDERSVSAEKSTKPSILPPASYFEPGSYVMAAWRNQYEYLAEVIAHRHRQGDKSEYRLRYVWDNVIEWTPIHRIRRATQFEIDFVLKFCREHSNSAAGRSSEVYAKSSSRGSHDTVSEVKSRSNDATGLTTRSQVRKKEPGRKDDTTQMAHSPTQPYSNKPTSAEQKHTLASSNFDSVEQDGMLYDKTVLQFHEACRKRRELKRQAIEMDQQAATKLEVSSSASPGTPTTAITPDDQKPNLCPVESELKPPKVPRPAESPTTTSCIAKEISTADILCAEQTSGSVPGSKADEAKAGTSPIKLSAAVKSVTSTVASPVKKCSGSPKLLTEGESKAASPAVKQPQQSIVSPTQTSPPVIYPCPYCPRQLRHSKLLAAHLSNYHKDLTHPHGSNRSSAIKTEKIARSSPKRIDSNPVHSTNLSSCSSMTLSTTSTGTNKSIPKSPEHPESMRALCCIRCDSRWNVNDSYPGLIQCNSCLCWMHEACYGLSSASRFPGSSSFSCDGCLLKTRPARASRIGEANLGDNLGEPPFTKEDTTLRKLISDASGILQWSHRLRPLVDTGWNILNGSKVPSPPLHESVSSKHKVNPNQENDKNQSECKKREGNSSRILDLHETPSNEDHVNRLYMELRESLVDGVSEAHPSRRSLSNSLSDEPPFPSSLPDSECPTACWPLADDVDGTESSVVDPHLSQQVLTGFLQELGPNVISEFVELSTDPTDAEVEVTDVSYFLPRTSPEKSIVQQPPCSQSDLGVHSISTTETPTKGLGAILASPSGVASLLKATVAATAHPNDQLALSFAQNGVVDSGNPLSPSDLQSKSNFTEDDSTSNPVVTESSRFSSTPNTVLGNFDDTGFIDNSNLNVTSPETSVQPGSLTTLSKKLNFPPTSRAVKLCSDPPGIPTTSVNHITNDVDWLAVTSVANGSISSPFVASVPYRKSSLKESLCNPATIYDALGTSTALSLDAITDTLTPEDVAEAHLDLDRLEQFILSPLERTLSVMESQLDSVSEQLVVLERGMNWSGSSKILSNPCRRFDVDDTEISDYYLHSSDSSSAFGSSPSLSSSPNFSHEEPQSGLNQLNLRCAVLSDRSTKQAARLLYRCSKLQRPISIPVTNAFKHSSNRSSHGHKTSCVFSKNRPPSAVHLLDDRL